MSVVAKERTHRYGVRTVWTAAAGSSTKTYAGYSRDHAIAYGDKATVTGSADPAFRGNPALTNPEEMLVAALSSCHLLSYLALCALEGIAIAGYADDAEGTMLETGGAGKFARVVLRPRVTVDDDRLERARELHHRAHEQCFIANSVNFPVDCEPEIVRAGS